MNKPAVYFTPLSFILTFTVFFILCLFLPSVANAQALTGPDGGHLKFTPTYPTPHSTVRVGLELYSVSTGGASIRWYVNGTERTDATNARELEVETGAFGSELRLRAVVTPPGGASVSVERTMRPSELDLVVEGDTLIPLFYQGRALPAGGEAVAVTAIPHIAGYSNSSALSYTWTLGSTVLFNGPVKGKTRAVFTMPKTRTYLSVEVTDAEGEVLAGNTIALTSVRPELYFYEENPLRGLGERAFGEMFTLLGDETTVRAAPYFISKDIWVSNPVARWTINGGNANSGDDIRTLTLRSEGSGGEARIGFELTNRSSFLQSVSESFSIHFE